jgi:threonine/homoserine/homoserine lactone efflux protein
MSVAFLFKGLLLGLSIAAPVGPIGILCIRRSIADGPGVGFICGLGAAVADMAYALLGGFALATVSPLLVRGRVAMAAVGGAFLLYLGIRTFLAKPPAAGAVAQGGGTGHEGAAARDGGAAHAGGAAHERGAARERGVGFRAFLSTFVLTIANPMTILSFAAVFAGAGLSATGGLHYVNTGLLVAGVFAGSAAWWLLLSAAAGKLRRHVGPAAMRAINAASGVVLTVFGLYVLASLIPAPT